MKNETINLLVTLRAHEDSQGQFWKMHMDKDSGGGAITCHDSKPTDKEVKDVAILFLGHRNFTLNYEFSSFYKTFTSSKQIKTV
jgi:hypothetical protein